MARIRNGGGGGAVGNFVTTDTDQNIDAQKTFTNASTLDYPILNANATFNDPFMVLHDIDSGYSMGVTMFDSPPSDGTIYLPSNSASNIVLSANIIVAMQGKSLKTFGVNANSCSWQDGSAATQKLYMLLSGATGNNTMAIVSSAARAYAFTNASGGMSMSLFAQTADATVTNTVTETAILGTGAGTLTLPANFFNTIGRTVRLRVSGIYTTPIGAPSIIVKLKYGTTIIAQVTTTALVASSTNAHWNAEALITCRSTGATGTVVVDGHLLYAGAAGQVLMDRLDNTGAATTIDTTAARAIGVTVQWDAASSTRSVTSTVAVLENLSPV